MSLPLTPLSVTPGTNTSIVVQNPDTVNAIILHNKSYLDLIIDGIDGAGPRWLVAGTSDIFLSHNNSFKGAISVQAQNTANIPSNQVSVMIGTVYYMTDALPNGSWPVSIPTQVVSTLGSSTQQVINTTNAAGATVIEAKPNGNASDSFSMDNQGNIQSSGIWQLLQHAALRFLNNATPAGSTDLYGGISDKFINLDFTNNNNAGAGFRIHGVHDTIIRQDNATLDLDTAQVTTNGATSGNLVIIQPFVGSGIKLALLFFNSFKNASGSAQLIALPTQFNTGFFVYAGGTPPVSFVGSGSTKSIGVLTTIAAAGGTVTVQGTINNRSLGDVKSLVDSLSIASNANAFDGVMILLGS